MPDRARDIPQRAFSLVVAILQDLERAGQGGVRGHHRRDRNVGGELLGGVPTMMRGGLTAEIEPSSGLRHLWFLPQI